MQPYLVREVGRNFCAVAAGRPVPDGGEALSPAAQQVAESLKTFASDFGLSDARKVQRRAQRKNTTEEGNDSNANDIIMNVLAPCAPDRCAVAPAMPRSSPLCALCALANFAIKAGSAHCAQEKEGLWTNRLASSGTRMVAVIDAKILVAHLKAEGIVGMKKEDYLRTAQHDTIKKMFDKGVPIYYSTVGPDEALVLPANSVVLETVTSQCDVVGLRCGILLPRDVHGLSAFTEVADKVTTPSSHISKKVSGMCMEIVRAPGDA